MLISMQTKTIGSLVFSWHALNFIFMYEHFSCFVSTVKSTRFSSSNTLTHSAAGNDTGTDIVLSCIDLGCAAAARWWRLIRRRSQHRYYLWRKKLIHIDGRNLW